MFGELEGAGVGGEGRCVLGLGGGGGKVRFFEDQDNS